MENTGWMCELSWWGHRLLRVSKSECLVRGLEGGCCKCSRLPWRVLLHRNTRQEKKKKKGPGPEELVCSCVRQLSGSCDPAVSYWALRGRRENKSSVVIHELPCQLLAQDALKVREPPGEAPKQASAPLGSSPRLEAC